MLARHRSRLRPPPGYGQAVGRPATAAARSAGYGRAARLRIARTATRRPPWGRPTNTVAILALVMAFVFAPAGLILGIVARKQIRQTGEDGDGLALAGIIVGGIVTALFVLMFVFRILAFAASSYSFGPRAGTPRRGRLRPPSRQRRCSSSGGVKDDVRSIPAARPLPAMTSAILRLASSIISSPSIAEPFLPPASEVAQS